jgi:hypothetical protein
MARAIRTLVMILAVCLMAGCFESNQEYTLNPNGSGKVIHEVLFQPVDLNMGETPENPEKELKKTVQSILTDSSGVDAWKDISFKRTEDGKIFFKGTAYFPDLSKLSLKLGEVKQSGSNPLWTKTSSGDMVLELDGGDKGDKKKKGKEGAPSKPLTDAEIRRKIAQEKAQFQKMKPMLAAMLSTLKQKMTFHLPGHKKDVTNFKENPDGSFTITFDGAKMIELIDAMFTDEKWMAEMIQAKGGIMDEGPAMDAKTNEILFGQKGPIQAVMGAPQKPLFDYKTEMAAAKGDYPALLKRLGMASALPAKPATGEGFKSLKVGGVRIVRFSESDRGIRPFNYDAGYTLALVGQLPGAVLEVKGGMLEKAVSLSGDDLLPKRDWDRKISFPRLSKDKTAVIFEVNVALPGEKTKGFKEISGKLEYVVAGGSKEVDLGFTGFKAGTQGKAYGAAIKSIKESKWEKGHEVLALEVQLASDAVKSTRFLDAQGNPLKVSRQSTMSSGNTMVVGYDIEGKFPEKGTIVMEVFDDLKQFEIPFSLTDISLTGQPLK